jgi:hypothetical protein
MDNIFSNSSIKLVTSKNKLLNIVVVFFVYIISYLFFGQHWALGITCFIAFVKEFYDLKLGDGSYNVWDFFFVILPAVLMYFIF